MSNPVKSIWLCPAFWKTTAEEREFGRQLGEWLARHRAVRAELLRVLNTAGGH